MLLLTHLTILTVTLYLHRSCAHRAVEFPKLLQHFFRFWAWFTTGMTARQWASVHRKHHAKCETEDDPHSPQQLGLLRVLFLGVLLYRKAVKDENTVQRYGKGTPNDRLETFYENNNTLGLLLMGLIEVFLFGPEKGLYIFICQLFWIPFWAAGIINGVGHFIGYRNHNSDDASRNIFPIGIIIGGEELHNNHHAFPSSAKLSSRKWEFDWGWQVLKFLSFFKMATIKRIPPQLIKSERIINVREITVENLTAVVTCRFHAISEAKEKLKPTVLSAISHLTLPPHFSRKKFIEWYFKDQRAAKISEKTQEEFTEILAQSSLLLKIRHSILELYLTWSLPHFGPTELLNHFQTWLSHAEESGIESLKNLSFSLRSYQLAPLTSPT